MYYFFTENIKSEQIERRDEAAEDVEVDEDRTVIIDSSDDSCDDIDEYQDT